MKIKKILCFLSVVALMFMTVIPAQAANLTGLKDTLSTSEPNVVADHTFDFTVTTAIPVSGEIDVTLPAGFDLSSLVFGDVDIELNSVDQTVVAGAGPGAAEVGFVLSGQGMQFHFGSAVSLGAGQTVKIQVGDTAAGGPGNNQITNHAAAGIYTITLATYNAVDASLDTGDLKISLQDTITVSATVQSSLTFAIAGISNAGNNCPNADATGTTDITTTSTTIPFGTMTVDDSKIGCQELTVSTNATNGYIVTVEQNNDLTSAGTDTIDEFDGADGNTDTYTTPEVWVQPKDATPTTHTGYFGFTSDDATANSGNYASYKYAGYQDDNSPYEVAKETGPVSSEVDVVSYQLEVAQLQEAGVYTNTLMYICTATF
ncbi:hypothetical protein KJ855_03260 [Patescibacteria group bacterium]|nr:hypothetical protein [Patescibacteria group bacterium]